MSRYKGRSSAKAIERDFPHIVEMAVPPNGFGRQLDLMYDWHRAHNIEARRGSGRREDDRDIVRCVSRIRKPASTSPLLSAASNNRPHPDLSRQASRGRW